MVERELRDLTNKWRQTKEVQYIQEAIRLANNTKEDRVEAFLIILYELAGYIQQNRDCTTT